MFTVLHMILLLFILIAILPLCLSRLAKPAEFHAASQYLAKIIAPSV